MRELIEELSLHSDLVLFYAPKEIDVNLLPAHIEKRPITSYKSNLWNKIWNTCYRFGGNTPKSSLNKLNWVKRRFGSSNKKTVNYIELVSAYLAHYFPDLIDFGKYLSRLQFNLTNIEGIDTFLSFTDVNDPYFTAQLINSNKRLYTYVYSWDHAAKYHKFSKQDISYLTWNQYIKEDLIYQHNIPSENIEIVGSTQLSLLSAYFDNNDPIENPWNSKPYIYFAASAGYRTVAEQEVEYVEYIANTLASIAPEMKVVFRPYPLLQDWSLYEPILKLENVAFDNFRFEGKKVVFTNDDILTKFKKIEDATVVFHCGSTFGMEAAYFNTPVYFIRFEDFPFKKSVKKIDRIENFIYQYHIKKYLDVPGYDNVLTSYHQVISLFEKLSQPDYLYTALAYNNHIVSYTPLRGITEITVQFIDQIKIR